MNKKEENLNNLLQALYNVKVMSLEDTEKFLALILKMLVKYKDITENVNSDTKKITTDLLNKVLNVYSEIQENNKKVIKLDKSSQSILKEVNKRKKEIQQLILEFKAIELPLPKEINIKEVVDQVVKLIDVPNPEVFKVDAEDIVDKINDLPSTKENRIAWDKIEVPENVYKANKSGMRSPTVLNQAVDLDQNTKQDGYIIAWSNALQKYIHILNSGGGGGSSTYAALTDAATVNLPSINTPLATALNLKEDKINKGAANGYASLDGTGKVPANQLPSYVDDVIEVANFAALPVTGEAGKIYVTLDNNKTFRWTGSIYVEISPNTPAGTNGQIQFNNSGAFGADSALFWDNVNKRLDVKKLTNTSIGDATTYGIVIESGATSGALALGVDANYSYLQSFNSKPLWINPAGNNIILGGVGVTVGINNITATNGNTLAVNGKLWINNQLFLGNTQAAPYATFYATSNGAQIDTQISGVGNGRMIFSVNNVEKSRMNDSGNWGYLTNAPTHTQTHSSVSNGIALYNTADQTTNFEIARHFWTINQYVIQTSQGGTGIARDINVNSSLFKANGRFNVQGVTQNFIGAMQSSPGDATLFVYRSAGEGVPPTIAGTVAQFGSNSAPGFSSSIGIISGTAGNASLNFGDKDSDISGVLQFSNVTNTFSLNREISLTSNKIVNLATPTLGTDATNKNYVDSQNTTQDSAIAGKVQSVTAGTNVTITGTATNPIINATASGGGSPNTFVDSTPDNGSYRLLSGAVDGVNSIYTVFGANYVSGSLIVALNGQIQTQGSSNDWQETAPASGTFTFINLPQIGDVITVSYQTIASVSTGVTTTSIEVDFGTKPIKSKKFTITDAGITSTSKILAYGNGAPATGRVGDDWDWDSISFAARAGTGSFVLSAVASGRIIGKRKVFYSSA